jgi:hypothetical protein
LPDRCFLKFRSQKKVSHHCDTALTPQRFWYESTREDVGAVSGSPATCPVRFSRQLSRSLFACTDRTSGWHQHADRGNGAVLPMSRPSARDLGASAGRGWAARSTGAHPPLAGFAFHEIGLMHTTPLREFGQLEHGRSSDTAARPGRPATAWPLCRIGEWKGRACAPLGNEARAPARGIDTPPNSKSTDPRTRGVEDGSDCGQHSPGRLGPALRRPNTSSHVGVPVNGLPASWARGGRAPAGTGLDESCPGRGPAWHWPSQPRGGGYPRRCRRQ